MVVVSGSSGVTHHKLIVISPCAKLNQHLGRQVGDIVGMHVCHFASQAYVTMQLGIDFDELMFGTDP